MDLRGWQLLALGLTACAEDDPSSRAMPASAGAVQPPGNGSRIDEAAACDRLTAALSTARARLGCGALASSCPAAVRPAGGACQADYDEGSLSACAAIIEAYESCADFELSPCIVTAYVETAVGCGRDAGLESDAAPDGADASELDASG